MEMAVAAVVRVALRLMVRAARCMVVLLEHRMARLEATVEQLPRRALLLVLPVAERVVLHWRLVVPPQRVV